MRPRVTLQLPGRPLPATRPLSGARVLLVGEGYVARALRPGLERAGARVDATARDGEWALAGPRARAAFAAASHVLVSVPPGRAAGPDPALRALGGAETRADWIGYLSATSVYGDRAGGWAFEGEAPTPGLARGVRRADAEAAWLERFSATHLFRLAGIYGPGRSPFAALRDGTARVVEAPGHVVNRIHVEDIARALLLSMARPCPGEILNIADGRPAPPWEVTDFAAHLLGLPPPPRVPLMDRSVSDMARSFYRETKRIAVGRAASRLGWTPLYPSYRAGLEAVLAADQGMVT